MNCFQGMENELLFDPMTKVLRKGSLQLYVSKLIQNHIPFSYYFIDFDKFKKVNDMLSHQVGDATLCAFARLIQESIPENSLLARYGGDEFVFVVENMVDYDECWKTARNVVQAIRNHPQDYLKPAFPEGKITATIGISRYPNDGKDFDEINLASDHALYRGKEKGRDCFIIFDKDKYNQTRKNEELNNMSLTDVISLIFSSFEKEENPDDVLKKLLLALGRIYRHRYFVRQDRKESLLLFEKTDITDTRYVPFPYGEIQKLMNKDMKIIRYSSLHSEEYPLLVKAMEESNIHSFVSLRLRKKDEDAYLLIESRREGIYSDEELAAFQVLGNVYSMKKYQ